MNVLHFQLVMLLPITNEYQSINARYFLFSLISSKYNNCPLTRKVIQTLNLHLKNNRDLLKNVDFLSLEWTQVPNTKIRKYIIHTE